MQLTCAAAAVGELASAAGKPPRQTSRPNASSMDPRVRQQVWKLARPPPGKEAARESRGAQQPQAQRFLPAAESTSHRGGSS